MAGNLKNRVQNVLTNLFNVNNLNELTTVGRSGTFTVAGGVQGSPSSVTVNSYSTSVYGDATFAKDGFSLSDGTNTFTAIATDSYGRWATNTSISYLPASTSFAYDLNGNLRTNGTRVLEYDDENQLIRVTEPGAWRSEFAYDGKMRRRVRKEYRWQSGTWVQTAEVRYVYDGNLVIQERNGQNLPQVTYTRGKDLSGTLEGAGGIGGLLARTDNALLAIENPAAHAYYHADGNGNVTALINVSELVVARYLYDPYGNTLSATGPLAEANLYRFSSKELHLASGMVYYLYRFYEPSLQRWINRDPIEEEGGYNLNWLLENDPANRIDDYGLAEHKKKRPSTYNKHTRPRSGRPTTKQRTKPGWIDAKTGKKVRCFPMWWILLEVLENVASPPGPPAEVEKNADGSCPDGYVPKPRFPAPDGTVPADDGMCIRSDLLV